MIRFPTVQATRLRFNITDSKAGPLISNIGVYNAPQILTPPTIIRNQAGDVIITPADPESEVYYTFDGSEPATGSNKYLGPIPADGKLEVKAIAFEPSSERSSSVSHEKFDLPRKEWRILGIEDEKSNLILDGDPFTAWHQKTKEMPVDLVIDLGKDFNIIGFTYHPDMGLCDQELFLNTSSWFQLIIKIGNWSARVNSLTLKIIRCGKSKCLRKKKLVLLSLVLYKTQRTVTTSDMLK